MNNMPFKDTPDGQTYSYDETSYTQGYQAGIKACLGVVPKETEDIKYLSRDVNEFVNQLRTAIEGLLSKEK